METKKVRVRFAPSPTGPLHIGGVRTALYNYLFAKKHGGDFLLRIEDTDQTRFVPGAENYIIEALNWCGIHYNEGVGIGGPHAPYKQSERKELYKQYAEFLLQEGCAYYAFDTADDLDKIRKEYESKKQTFQYGIQTRMNLINSLTLAENEVNRRLQAGDNFVIRVKIPENEEVIVQDLIRGKVVFQSTKLDDKVLYKSDGMPTYHLANVVDDFLMKISHVIRGEEWLPSAPLHVLLYRFLGWEKEMPQFAHLPLLLKPDGNGKLSKRDGDRLGFPVFPLQWTDPFSKEISSGYREAGYFPEAVVNILALLGWNLGTEKEVFSMEELMEAFTLERVHKAGSKFNPEKAKWFNHHYLQEKSEEEIVNLFTLLLLSKGIASTPEFITKVISLVKNRATFITDLWDQSHFFFVAPVSYDAKVIKDKWKNNSASILTNVNNVFQAIEMFYPVSAKTALTSFLEGNQTTNNEQRIGMGQVMNVLRLVLVGSSSGPDLFEIVCLLGKDEVKSRIEKGIKAIST